MRVQFRWGSAPVEGRFRLLPTPVLISHNRVQKPRMGGWRLESLDASGSPELAQALARLDRMMYLSGPTAGMKPLMASKSRQAGRGMGSLWQVDSPQGLQVFAYLTEVRPGLLALSYLSGSFQKGDLVKIEVQLESARLGSGVQPAENGMALLGALRRLEAEGKERSDELDLSAEWVSSE